MKILKTLKFLNNKRMCSKTLSVLLCVSVFVASFASTISADTINSTADNSISTNSGAKAVQSVDNNTDENNNDIIGQDEKSSDANGSDSSSARFSMLRGNRDATASYSDRLTDRSNDIGVYSEGYSDSPCTFEKTYNISANVWTSDMQSAAGGTIYIGKDRLGRDIKVWQAEQYWDGSVPFRITSAAGANGTVDFQNYNDFLLEDNSAPSGAFKIDNINLEYCRINLLSQLQNLYARGNKLVIGENVTTESGKTWKIYGGTEHDELFNHGRPDILTNVVVASGNWGSVFGGGEGPAGRGTQVTIRGNATVGNVYGGGERKGSIGTNETGIGDGVNVYVEGGTVTNLYGGSAINSRDLLTGSHALTVNEDININISGGNVTRVVGTSDTTDTSTMDASTLASSPVNGNSVINISSADSVSSVAGDPNRNHSTAPRQVKGYTRLNVTASNDFTYFDDFDVVNIAGENVVVTSDSKPGDSFTDSNLTFWGSSNRDGYIGQIRVAEGAKLVLDQGGVINKPYNGSSAEADSVIQATANHNPFYHSKSWVGESSEARRSLSTVAIDGTGAGITAASGSSFNDSTDVCGLRIHGTVQGALGDSSSYNNNVPGYSTLEVTGTPIYSTADDYYYYIVSDGSANGGKAFTEPEGADYVVCYRFLDNGKIGWYLRERPEISINNKLVRSGETGNMVMRVDMNGFEYEWNSTASNNTVDFGWTKTTGTDENALTTVTDGISLSSLAGIESDSSGRFSNIVFQTENGVRYLESFDYIIDSSTPTDPVYYDASINYHVVGTYNNVSYEDNREANDADAARCVYDFAGNDNLHSSEGYADSVMQTYPYDTSPAGEDTALLRLYLPYGVTGNLNVSENDGHFRFTTDFTIDAQLIDSDTVVANYTTANEATSNSRYAVTIGGDELSSGVTKTLSSSVSKYVCTVYSHKGMTIDDISQNNANGLQLNLALSGLSKGGNSVGDSNPSAVNNGELQIKAFPYNQTISYKLCFRFTTRTQGVRDYVEKGELTAAEFYNMGNQLSDEFILSKAPYESNHGETLNWSNENITRSELNGVKTALITSVQSVKKVYVNYRTTPTGPYDTVFEASIGANRLNDANVAEISVPEESGGLKFNYWEIRKSGESSSPVIAKCYDADFSYCIMDNYWISPVYSESEVTPASDGKSITLTHLDYSRNRWTDSEGVPSDNGRSDYLYTDFEIAYVDSGNDIFSTVNTYRTGIAFELCRQLDLNNNEQFVQGYDYGFVSNEANLKQAILNGSSSYNADGNSRRIQYSNISTSSLTNKNRIEFGKSYYNAYKIESGIKKYTNATYILKATAYFIDSNNAVTLSNPVYVCLYDISQQNFMFS